MATGVLHSWLREYYTHGYGSTTLMATGVLHSWLREYYTHGYGCTMLTATGVSWLQLRACYRCTIGMWQGVNQPLVTTATIMKSKSDD